MSAPVRFLAVAVAGWTLFRGITAGVLPGVEVFTLGKAEAAPAPIAATQFPPITPIQQEARTPTRPRRRNTIPHTTRSSRDTRLTAAIRRPIRSRATFRFLSTIPRHAWRLLLPRHASPCPQSRKRRPNSTPRSPSSRSGSRHRTSRWRCRAGAVRSASRRRLRFPFPPSSRARSSTGCSSTPGAMYRGTPGSGSLASNGTLGGSQVGGRLSYAFNPALAASLRWSSPIGSVRGGEAAAGIRWKPIASIPVAITAERRQAVGRYSTGRSDFALFAEGGLYERPIGWNLMLDGHAQAGVVGLQTRDPFADGGFAVSRPLWGRFSAGLGAWGGYQPGLYRIDAGPRVSMRLRQNVSVHLDWRQRLAGTAEPASGPALTVGANF